MEQSTLRSVGNQRFCTRKCSDAFYAEERRAAVVAYRATKSREPVTYYQLGLADAVADVGGGGRFARREPVAVDPVGAEPPHDGRDEGAVYGLDVSGVGGLDGAALERDDDAI